MSNASKSAVTPSPATTLSVANSISPKAEEFYAERMKATTSHIDGSHTAFIPRHAEIAEVIRAAAEA